MKNKEPSQEILDMVKTSPRLLEVFFENFPTKPYSKNTTNMKNKEQKRDKNGRFAKKSPKVEAKVNVEPKPEKDLSDLVCISRGEWEQLKLERDAFKETAERFMGKYLTACVEKKEQKELESYKRHWNRLMSIAKYWKGLAHAERNDRRVLLGENAKLMCENVSLMAIGTLLRDCASWWKLRKRKDELNELTRKMDEDHKKILQDCFLDMCPKL